MPASDFALVGMAHLPPLPGAPNHAGTTMAELVDRAVADARVLAEAGFDAVMLQNAYDVPALPRVGPETVAAMAVIADHVRRATDLPIGLTVAHNDGPAAIAIANAVGAEYIRVKVLTGAAVGAAGLITGCAAEVAQLRRRLASKVEIWADVHEVTSAGLGFEDPIRQARQHVRFGGADALIVTHDDSAAEAIATVRRIKDRLGPVKAIVGGRVTDENAALVEKHADGAIIGTAVRTGDGWFDTVDSTRARGLAAALARGHGIGFHGDAFGDIG